MKHYINYDNRLLVAAVLAGDMALVISLFYLLYTGFLAPFVPAPGYDLPLSWLLTIVFLCYALCSWYKGVVLYKRKVWSHQIVMKVLRNVVWFTALLFTVWHLNGLCELGDTFLLVYSAALLVVLSVYRLAVRSLVKASRRHNKNLRKVILVGDTDNLAELFHEIHDDIYSDASVCGYFADRPNAGFPAACAYLGKIDTVTSYLHDHPSVQNLFCSLPSADRARIVPLIDYCENHLVHFFSVPNLRNYLHNRVYFSMMGDVPFLSLHRTPLNDKVNRVVKRLFDVVVSLTFLCTLFPFILLAVTLITKLTMPGPVFFRQKRNGLNNKEFYCLKFRSMKVNKEADTLQATKNDPRKTKWGNLMRKTNIDELPQFINVLLGDMSLVGPRPHMLKHTEEYSKLIDKYMVRHYVKPGITGWSQVTGFRGETKELSQMEGRIHGDIWYIEHWSFWLDLYIMYRTVANVFKGEKNAY